MTSQVVYKGNLRTEATHLQSGSLIETDAPTDNNGKGERFSPTDIVATALGGCMLTVMGIKAETMNIDLTGTRLDIQKTMAANPRRISGIQIAFHFPDSLQLSQKEQTILEHAAHTCPIGKSLHPDIDVAVTFGWKEMVE